MRILHAFSLFLSHLLTNRVDRQQCVTWKDCLKESCSSPCSMTNQWCFALKPLLCNPPLVESLQFTLLQAFSHYFEHCMVHFLRPLYFLFVLTYIYIATKMICNRSALGLCLIWVVLRRQKCPKFWYIFREINCWNRLFVGCEVVPLQNTRHCFKLSSILAPLASIIT